MTSTWGAPRMGSVTTRTGLWRGSCRRQVWLQHIMRTHILRSCRQSGLAAPDDQAHATLGRACLQIKAREGTLLGKTTHLRMQSELLPAAWPVEEPS